MCQTPHFCVDATKFTVVETSTRYNSVGTDIMNLVPQGVELLLQKQVTPQTDIIKVTGHS